MTTEFHRSPTKIWYHQPQSPKWQPPEDEDDNHRTSSSPNSHKSQDSGFSDSELSILRPPPQTPPPKHRFNQTAPIYTPPHHDHPHRLNISAPTGNELEYDSDQISFASDVDEPKTPELSFKTPAHHSTPNCHNRQFPVSRQLIFMTPTKKNNFVRRNSRKNDDFVRNTETRQSTNYVDRESSDLVRQTSNKYESPNYIECIRNTTRELPKSVEFIRNPIICESSPSVTSWLNDLTKLYETECMITLQSKSLAADLSRRVAAATTQITQTLKSVFTLSKIIYSDFGTIQRQLRAEKIEYLGPLVQSLNGNLTEFVLNFVVGGRGGGEDAAQHVLEGCDVLRRGVMDVSCALNVIQGNVEVLMGRYRDVEQNVIAVQIQLLLQIINDPTTTDLTLRGAIQSITWLATQQHNPCIPQLLTQFKTPRTLLHHLSLHHPAASTLRTSTLRALTTLSCYGHAQQTIKQLNDANAIQTLTYILADLHRPEPEHSETIALLIQIIGQQQERRTTKSLMGLRENTKSLVTSLTRIVTTTKCCQILLLCSAALANLTCVEPTSVWPLLELRTAQKLLEAVQMRGPMISVFLKEQVATLLANMSAASESRQQLGEAKAVAALLCFLQIAPNILLDEGTRGAEHAANLRLQQKAAVALSRLCAEPSICQQVVELGGVNQLVRLCKEKRERSHSDAVLVACLSALRKIATNCGATNVMDEEDAIELVEPHLLDSFLTYASQNESYV